MSTKMLLRTAGFVSALALSPSAFAQSKDALNVVASFSILGDMVQQVGGDAVNVTVLVGAGADSHVYTPTPADARSLSKADVLVVNGLDFEGWLPRLVEAANFDGQTLIATTGITPLAFDKHGDEEHHDEHGDEEHHDEHGDEEHHDEHGDEEHHDEHGDEDHHDEHGDEDHHGHNHGAYDPHAWQSLELAQVYVANIADALVAADPENALVYVANAASYTEQLSQWHATLSAQFAALDADHRTVVTSHDAFGYFENAYGVEFLAPQGLSTESEASAQDVANIIRQIRAQGINAVFVENISDPRLIRQIANETDAQVGGTLYSDSLSGKNGPAATYLDMVRYNAEQILSALQ